ncbi:MAG: GGDEF domain-containing protein [Kibdelosporangium sp.]
MLRRHVRSADAVGRLGGEEFAMLLEDTDQADAARLLVRLLEEFSRLEHATSDGGRFSVTFSAGVVALDAGAMDLDVWKESADAALYRAKAAGRARVEMG